MPNIAVNCLAGNIFVLPYTWGFEEAEGETTRPACAAFIVEVGVARDVLQQNFTKLGDLATKGNWFHNLWEFVCYLKYSIEIDPKLHVQPAHVRDIPIMEQFSYLSLDKNNLSSLNRVQRFKQVLFLSDLVHCNGTIIRGSMTDRMEGSSPLIFPKEKPTRKEFELWVGAICSISSPGSNCKIALGTSSTMELKIEKVNSGRQVQTFLCIRVQL